MSTDNTNDTTTTNTRSETKTKTKANVKNHRNYTKKRNYNSYSQTKDTTHDQIFRVVELAAIATPRQLIASATNLTVNQVDNIINRYKDIYPQLSKLDDLRKVRSQLVEASMYNLLESMNDRSCIDDADLKQRAYAFTQTYNAFRLETNKSTANHQHLSITNPKKTLSELD